MVGISAAPRAPRSAGPGTAVVAAVPGARASRRRRWIANCSAGYTISTCRLTGGPSAMMNPGGMDRLKRLTAPRAGLGETASYPRGGARSPGERGVWAILWPLPMPAAEGRADYGSLHHSAAGARDSEGLLHRYRPHRRGRVRQCGQDRAQFRRRSGKDDDIGGRSGRSGRPDHYPSHGFGTNKACAWVLPDFKRPCASVSPEVRGGSRAGCQRAPAVRTSSRPLLGSGARAVSPGSWRNVGRRDRRARAAPEATDATSTSPRLHTDIAEWMQGAFDSAAMSRWLCTEGPPRLTIIGRSCLDPAHTRDAAQPRRVRSQATEGHYPGDA